MLLDPCVIGTGQLLDKFEAFGLNLCCIIELREQQLLEAVIRCLLEDQGYFGAGRMPRDLFVQFKSASLSWLVLCAEDGGICCNMAKPQPCLPITAAEPHISSPFRVNVLVGVFFFFLREGKLERSDLALLKDRLRKTITMPTLLPRG